jgi:hypothetical protein
LLERLEGSLAEIADTVYLHDMHMDVFSSRMARQLYETGVIPEGLMKKNIEELYARGELPNGTPRNIIDYKNALERILQLSKREVTFRLFTYQRSFYPFIKFGEPQHISPAWWVAYNGVKHDFLDPRKIQRATLRHLIEGVGAVFLLTVLCISYLPKWVLDHRIVARSFVGAVPRDELPGEITYEKLLEALFNRKAQ